MAPSTRSKNANQHPGQVVLENKQKRRTSEQKQADDVRVEKLKQAQTEAREQGLRRVAAVIEHAEQDAESVLMNPPKPRPRIVLKPPMDPSPQKGDSRDSRGSALDVQQDEDDKETPTQTQAKRQRMQKTSTRDAVEAARGNLHQDLEADHHAVDRPDQEVGTRSVDGQPENSPNQASAKTSVAGVSQVKDWADKLASAKFLHPQRLSSSSSRHTRSVSTTSSLSNEACTASASVTIGASTPTNGAVSLTSEPTENDNDPYIQGSDKSERQAIPDPGSKVVTKRTDAMDVAEVVSDSEPVESVIPLPIGNQADAKKPEAKESKGKGRRKRIHQAEQVNEGDSQNAPPSKRSKAAPHSTSGSQRSGSGVNKKYVKDDLPPGSTTDNIWRRLFISALAHFAGGYDDPWSIPSDKFNSVLQEIWNTVYMGSRKIEHTITVNGPVFQIAKQNLNNWRSGFAAAAIAVITTFFANDAEFADPAQRTAFAKDMLKKNRFLFKENRGTDAKAWTGLWRGVFVLQTFAHHFNYIQGRVGITTLDMEPAGPRTALALACAAVCRILTLVVNGNITFKSGNSGNTWNAVIPKGSQYEFNDAVWGSSTRRYHDPIKELTDENFALVVEETQDYVKKPSVTPSAGNSELDGEDSEFDNLYDFR